MVQHFQPHRQAQSGHLSTRVSRQIPTGSLDWVAWYWTICTSQSRSRDRIDFLGGLSTMDGSVRFSRTRIRDRVRSFTSLEYVHRGVVFCYETKIHLLIDHNPKLAKRRRYNSEIIKIHQH